MALQGEKAHSKTPLNISFIEMIHGVEFWSGVM